MDDDIVHHDTTLFVIPDTYSIMQQWVAHFICNIAHYHTQQYGGTKDVITMMAWVLIIGMTPLHKTMVVSYTVNF